MDKSGNGYLKIRVTEVGGTVPVENAAVTVSEKNEFTGENEILFALETDPDGNTRTVMLPAPRLSESLAPGSKQPYSLYTVHIEKEGFVPARLTSVPVFDGITSVQSVNLLPTDTDAGYPEIDSLETVIDEAGNGYPDTTEDASE